MIDDLIDSVLFVILAFTVVALLLAIIVPQSIG